jgi:hypothetical protein
MPADQWLTRAEQADHLNVTVETIGQYVQRYGPTHGNPYPVHMEGQHRRFGRSTAVSARALDAWQARRTGRTGRPRTCPPGLTVPQWRALIGIADGKPAPAPRLIVALIAAGYITRDRSTPSGYRPTRPARILLAAYPATENGDPS